MASGLLAAIGGCGGAPAPLPGGGDGPPMTASVRDGLLDDLDVQESHTALFANWDPFVDPEGLLVIYEWSVGTAPGTTDVIGWTDAGGATQAAASGLELPRGVVLHVNVRARDIRGQISAIASSDGIVAGQSLAQQPRRSPREGAGAAVGPMTSIDHSGITWVFDKPVQCGRFANGDWWVVGPVDLVAIQPPCVADGTRIRHGSMINPDPRALTQSYDSAMFGEHAAGRYDATRNVALGVTRQKPLHLAAGSSLVSTISHAQPGQLPQLESCAVLTCLDKAPPTDAFRPAYCGTDKTCRWTAKDLDLARLGNLEPVDGAPRLGDLVERFESVWLDHLPGWTGAYLHPRANMPDYGRELADLVGQAALALQLARPLDEKRALAIALVQLGIDNAGVVQNGGRFLADGGSGAGRKFPVLLAGWLLHDDALLQLAKEHKLAFAEDGQTFFVAETAPGVVNHGFGGYGPEDVGLAEWGNRHADDPSLDQKAWTADPYRRCCTANAWVGFVLAARVMGLREAWGHDALFDYVDRYMQIEAPNDWTRSWSRFAERMWDRHRGEF